MKKIFLKISPLFVTCFLVIGVGFLCFSFYRSNAYPLDLGPYFIKTEKQAFGMVEKSKLEIEKIVSQLEAYRNTNISFDFFFKELDKAQQLETETSNILDMCLRLGADSDLAEKTQGLLKDFSAWCQEKLSMNIVLCEMAKNVISAEGNLSPKELYHAKNIIEQFERSGAALNETDRNKFAALQGALIDLDLQFEGNIRTCQDGIWVARTELVGISENVIQTLRFDEEKNAYFLGVDYPTYFSTMSDCSNPVTRQKLYEKFIQRAYPANILVIEKMRQVRYELATLLGYKTYADFDCASTMAGTVEIVENFLDLVDNATRQAAIEDRELLFSNIDSNIKSHCLNPEGPLVHSDMGFATNQLEKKFYNIDQEKIAEYFPVKHTIQKLLDIYSNFFGITFKQRASESWWWVNNLVVLDVFEDTVFLGSIVLDLYPRKNKYTHACCTTVKTGHCRNGFQEPAIAIMIANFSPAIPERDGLLKHDEVITFFHEFGHALHAIFSSAPWSSETKIGFASGCAVKMDFIETPSQMFEQWMWKPHVIKSIAKHYATGKSLDDGTITQLCASHKYLNAMSYFQRQVMLARYALSLHRFQDDLIDLKNKELERVINILPPNPDSHHECSFGHLKRNYGSKYYSYLWSLVYALDLFDCIDKQGLDNPEVGKRFRKEILEPGGSRDPRESVRAFLGRDVSYEPLMCFVNNA